jgi:hypothetical protein
MIASSDRLIGRGEEKKRRFYRHFSTIIIKYKVFDTIRNQKYIQFFVTFILLSHKFYSFTGIDPKECPENIYRNRKCIFENTFCCMNRVNKL